MIEFKNVTKIYDNVLALNKLNLKIDDGQIFGLIGHNGAGKSTAIKCLIGFIEYEGSILIDHLNYNDDFLNYKLKIAYVSDNPNHFLNFTPMQYFDFIIAIYNLNQEESLAKIKKCSELFNLNNNLDELISSFSNGMRQKVFIIATFITNPKVWILDEPMTGLDPQSAFEFKKLMKMHAENGNIVIFSTHILEVAENLCHKIGILKNGNLIYSGDINTLKQIHNQESLENIYLAMVQ